MCECYESCNEDDNHTDGSYADGVHNDRDV